MVANFTKNINQIEQPPFEELRIVLQAIIV